MTMTCLWTCCQLSNHSNLRETHWLRCSGTMFTVLWRRPDPSTLYFPFSVGWEFFQTSSSYTNAWKSKLVIVARQPCWPPTGLQMSHQRWIWGFHQTQAMKPASEESALALKHRARYYQSSEKWVSVVSQKGLISLKIFFLKGSRSLNPALISIMSWNLNWKELDHWSPEGFREITFLLYWPEHSCSSLTDWEQLCSHQSKVWRLTSTPPTQSSSSQCYIWGRRTEQASQSMTGREISVRPQRSLYIQRSA